MKSKNQLYGLIRIILVMLLFAYVMFISWRMFFYAYGSYYRSYSALPEYNLIPFKTLLSLIVNFEYYELDVWIYNLFGNIAAFVPFGLLLPAVFNVKKKFAVTILLSLIFLLGAETAQLIFRVGVFDVDDLILNMTGVILGYLIYIAISRINKIKE